MVWRSSTEIIADDGLNHAADWDAARQLTTQWTDAALTTSTITVAGDGKYRVTYSGAQNLDTITETGDDTGYVLLLKADTVGAAGALTIRHGIGNLFCNQGVDIVLANPEEWALFVQHGANFYGGKQYESGA